MDDSRVERYKEYRKSFIKEGAIPFDDPSEPTPVDLSSTASTLPIDEVINAVQDERDKEALIRFNKRNRILSIVLKITLVIFVIAGLIVLGYFAWGR